MNSESGSALLSWLPVLSSAAPSARSGLQATFADRQTDGNQRRHQDSSPVLLLCPFIQRLSTALQPRGPQARQGRAA